MDFVNSFVCISFIYTVITILIDIYDFARANIFIIYYKIIYQKILYINF